MVFRAVSQLVCIQTTVFGCDFLKLFETLGRLTQHTFIQLFGEHVWATQPPAEWIEFNGRRASDTDTVKSVGFADSISFAGVRKFRAKVLRLVYCASSL